jgi:hypothetical protein
MEPRGGRDPVFSRAEPASSFEFLLDEVCERLSRTQNRNSLGRIQKMEEMLGSLERELEKLLKPPV